MKKLIIIGVLLITGIILLNKNLSAQADTLLNYCTQYLPAPYLSDGQQYKTLLNEDEIAEFRVTFYGGSTYRVVACSGLSDGNVIYSILDKERNELYSNRNYKNAAYWDFKFNSTVDCIIEAHLDPRGPKSGFAILLIGFKQ